MRYVLGNISGGITHRLALPLWGFGDGFSPLVLGLATAVFAGTVGCRSTNHSGSAAKIFGGTEITNDHWQMVVAIVSHEGGPNGSTQLCSGTLIAPQLIATAAHCFEDHPTVENVGIFFGDGVEGGQEAAIDKYNVNPNYNNTAVTDFAYARLAAPAAEDIFPVLTDPGEENILLQPGQMARIVGFGKTNTGIVGVKFRAITTFQGRADDGALVIGEGTTDTCQGDSGGPAFGQLPDQSWRVYGITSRGPVGCQGGAEYAYIKDGLCWMEQDSGIRVAHPSLACDQRGGNHEPPVANGGLNGQIPSNPIPVLPGAFGNGNSANPGNVGPARSGGGANPGAFPPTTGQPMQPQPMQPQPMQPQPMQPQPQLGQCYCGLYHGSCEIFRYGEPWAMASFPASRCNELDCQGAFAFEIGNACQGVWQAWGGGQ